MTLLVLVEEEVGRPGDGMGCREGVRFWEFELDIGEDMGLRAACSQRKVEIWEFCGGGGLGKRVQVSGLGRGVFGICKEGLDLCNEGNLKRV